VCRLFGSDSEVMNSHDVEQKQVNDISGHENCSGGGKNPIVPQNKIDKCLVLPLSSLFNTSLWKT
jgi:hypothetical protein